MKIFISITLLSFALSLSGFQQKGVAGNDLDNEKYLNFLAAVNNVSTFSYFTVVKVKNLNTGEIKEICTKGNFVSGAIHMELGLGYDNAEMKKCYHYAISKKDRYFEFKNKKALENISFFNYEPELIEKIQKDYDIDKTIATIKQEKKFSIRLSDDQMKAFAHVLFNKGYMTGENDCWGGTLQYVDRKKEKL